MYAHYMTQAIVDIETELGTHSLTLAQIDTLYDENACFDFVDSLDLPDSVRADVCANLVNYHMRDFDV